MDVFVRSTTCFIVHLIIYKLILDSIIHSPIALHCVRQPIAEGGHTCERIWFSDVADLIAKGHDTDQDLIVLRVPSDQWTPAVSLTSTLRVLLVPLGAHNRGNDGLGESTRTLFVSDHLQAGPEQIRRGLTV